MAHHANNEQTGTGVGWLVIGLVVAVLLSVCLVPVLLFLWLFVSLVPVPEFGHVDLAGIHAACESGNQAAVAKWLDSGVNIDLSAGYSSDWQDGVTPLIVASASGHVELVEFLVERGADLDIADGRGYRASHVADLSSLGVLIRAGADIEARTAFGQTPLMVQAIFHRHEANPASVQLLLESGADVRAKGNHGFTILDTLSGFPDANAELLTLLRVAASDPDTTPHEDPENER